MTERHTRMTTRFLLALALLGATLALNACHHEEYGCEEGNCCGGWDGCWEYEGWSCDRDSDCLGDEFCDEGWCTREWSDRDCHRERDCDGRCPEPFLCEVDEDCGEGMYCDDGLCVLEPCECVEGSHCTADGTCEPDSEEPDVETCRNNDECQGGEVCFDGICRDACQDDGVCAEGEECMYGMVCLPGEEPEPEPEPEVCERSADCEDGVCLDGLCRDRCDTEADCDEGLVCDRGLCKPESDSPEQPNPEPMVGCQDSSECPDEQGCVDGYCRQACWHDCDCDFRTGEVCVDGYCMDEPKPEEQDS